MELANWRAVKIVDKKGEPLKNKWHCGGCDKLCTATLPLSESPSKKCGGGYQDEKKVHPKKKAFKR